MKAQSKVNLIAGQGVAGDRYAKNTGTFSALRWSGRKLGEREPGRQLTIISADAIDEALSAAHLTPATAKGHSYGDFRRNVVVRGYSAAQLLATQGTELCLGDNCRVFVHRHCFPLGFYNERMCGRPGQVDACFDATGVCCEVLTGGKLSLGDAVLPAPRGSPGHKNTRDSGRLPPSWYVPPTKRTAAMTESADVHMSATLDVLMATDPAGAARAEKAYNSVGLNFWPAVAWQKVLARRRRRAMQDFAVAGLVATSAAYVAWRHPEEVEIQIASAAELMKPWMKSLLALAP